MQRIENEGDAKVYDFMVENFNPPNTSQKETQSKRNNCQTSKSRLDQWTKVKMEENRNSKYTEMYIFTK